MIKPVHPFPARMAPELALRALGHLKSGSTILDPMTGSGTVLRQAVEFGHTAVGYDVDPLAVLMSNVWSSPVNVRDVRLELWDLIETAKRLSEDEITLPWQDNDPETLAFVDFWFAEKQKLDLRRLSYALHNSPDVDERILNIFKLALSRIIITKERAASLARDTSHSRPHKILGENRYDVLAGFERSATQILNRLENSSYPGTAEAKIGDARLLEDVEAASIDAIVTSPPYLNAIDYMRGHKLALVWLGHSIKSLRQIRTESIGAEKGLPSPGNNRQYVTIMSAMGSLEQLPSRNIRMIERYTHDMCKTLSACRRVLKATGRATFVVGNSCLKGVYIKNSEAVRMAAEFSGLKLSESFEREIPNTSRYLPITGDQLAKRMRTETILSFEVA